ncbi:MAG: methionyl-tRNA formyltransferase [Bacilli bacterium]|nr:methionyl-tRNA formyltransferase [Bacilli bacterium]
MNFFPPDYSIVYMGTPEISATVLSALLEDGFPIKALIASPDKEVGRKRILTPVPTKVVATSYGIPVYQPERIRKDYAFLEELKPDLILTMAYGQIVPQAVLDIPRQGCLNLHGSLLPKLRGAAPIQRSIIEGEAKTGVTLMEMVAAMDAGKMFAKAEVEILPEDNYGSLCQKIAQAAIEVAKDSLPLYAQGLLPGVPQDEAAVTFANKILPEDEKLNLNLPKQTFLNWIRGLSPTPGGYLLLEGEKFKILEAFVFDEAVGDPLGTLRFQKKGVTLQLCDGRLLLGKVQPAGKKEMDGAGFASGYRRYEGVTLL